jgi:hypothetical protein
VITIIILIVLAANVNYRDVADEKNATIIAVLIVYLGD